MKTKKAPYILLLSLFIVVVFILGVKYGKKVEKTDKALAFMLSITPTQKPTPTVPIGFKTYRDEGCGIQFLIPEPLTTTQKATGSAVFVDSAKHSVLSYTCLQLPSPTKTASPSSKPTMEEKIATEEVHFKNQQIVANVEKKNDFEALSFQTRNLRNGKTIHFTVEKNLFTLLESTLQYLP